METTERLVRRIRAPLGRARRFLRAVFDRRLHPYRRRKALRRLDGLRGSVSRTLFVCLGNKCRSPYAEARVRGRLDARGFGLEVSWAGLLPGGSASPPEAVAAAADRSLDLARHRSRAVTSGMVDRADLVVVMEPRQVARLPRAEGRRPTTIVLGDLDPEPVTRRAILDPWGRSRETFEAVFDRIDRCAEVLIDALAPDAGPGPHVSSEPRGSATDTPSAATR